MRLLLGYFLAVNDIKDVVPDSQEEVTKKSHDKNVRSCLVNGSAPETKWKIWNMADPLYKIIHFY